MANELATPDDSLEILVAIHKLSPRVTSAIVIDNKDGWGAVPFNQSVDYHGVKVYMKPSVFLSLAAPIQHMDAAIRKIKEIEDHLRSGGSIGAPFLAVSIPEEWEEGLIKGEARVTSHEGRHRMLAVQAIQGDSPIEVHIFIKYLRARDLTPAILDGMQDGILAEKTGKLVTPKGSPELFKISR